MRERLKGELTRDDWITLERERIATYGGRTDIASDDAPVLSTPYGQHPDDWRVYGEEFEERLRTQPEWAADAWNATAETDAAC